jgi:hypothetical protein
MRGAGASASSTWSGDALHLVCEIATGRRRRQSFAVDSIQFDCYLNYRTKFFKHLSFVSAVTSAMYQTGALPA